MNTHTSLENRIFDIINYVLALVSMLCIIGNFISGFPFGVNIKWLICIVISIVYYIIRRYEHIKDFSQLIYFIVLIFIIIPYGWIDSGGSDNNTIAYIFLVMICITFLFHGKKRIALIIGLNIVFVSLFLIEHSFPNIFKEYDSQSQFMDRLIQIPLTLTIGSLLVSKFANAYHKERLKIYNYSEQLKKANEQLSNLSRKDSLTGTYNRRAFDEALRLCLKNKTNPYVLLFDIDDFKKINDTLGHQLGDQCLCHVANKAKKILKPTTFISRWGGDEFALIYYGTAKELTVSLNKYMAKIMYMEELKHTQITLSIGITKVKNDDSIKAIFMRMDQLLYQAKANGKNQYLFDSCEIS